MSAPALQASALLLALAVVPVGTCLAQSMPKSASASFSALDKNRDGFLSKGEYNSDALFRALDRNRNNRVSAAELQAFLGPPGDGMLSAADRIGVADRNLDGELTDEELRRGAEMRFQWLDSNSDGKVDLPELRSGFGIPLVR